jgi:hypothetical protein
LSTGSSVNVLFELEGAGPEVILKQVPLSNLGDDTCIDPAQIAVELSPDVVVSIVEVNIASENVTVMLSVIDTELPLSAVVETEVTVGAVVSMTSDLFAPSEPEAPGDGNVRVASLEALSRMLPLFADRESVAL